MTATNNPNAVPSMSAQLDVEAVQTELGFGRYQLRTLVLILFPILVNAMHNSNFIFAAADLEYRCKVPECESESSMFLPGQWGEWALPKGDDARCYRYKPTNSSTTNHTMLSSSLLTDSSVKDDEVSTTNAGLLLKAGSPLEASTCAPQHFTEVRERCGSWVYGSNESIVSEFNLACEDWKRTLVGTVHSSGIFVALTFIGVISDRFGRLPVLVVTACSAALTGLARAFSQSYLMYIILEFIEPLLGSGVYTTACVLVMETMPVEYRVLTSTLLPISYTFGHVSLAGLAWILPGWRELLLALYAPSTIFFCYCLLLDESPRWLATRGRTTKAAAILLRAAKVNGVTFSPKVAEKLAEKVSPSNIPPPVPVPPVTAPAPAAPVPLDSQTQTKKKASIAFQVIRSKLLMRRLAMCGFWWITCALVFYGLSINSVSLAGNKYANFMLISIAEIPGYTLTVIALDRFGRRTCIRTAFMLCGIALISLPLIPPEMGSILLTLTLIGKVWISMAFGNLYIYTSELFPTQARHSMLAVSSMIGRIGQIVAPQTPLLMKLWKPLPYVTFGVTAGVAALLTLFAPETRLAPLSDTVLQAEEAHRARRQR